MNDMPKVIWAYPSYVTGWDSANAHNRPIIGSVRYIRADAPELVALVEAVGREIEASCAVASAITWPMACTGEG